MEEKKEDVKTLDHEKHNEEVHQEHKSSSLKSKWPFLLIALLLLLVIPLGGYFILGQTKNNSQTACTQEAKLCPDGSSVGRNGPNCEFAACPNAVPTSTSSSSTLDKTYTSTQHHFQIDYSSSLKVQTYPSTQIGQAGIGEVVIFSKVGTSQKEGTEFYDGISFTVGVMKKDAGQTLEKFADDQTKVDPDVGSRTTLKAIAINGLTGVETTVSGLGKIRNIFLEYPGKNDRVYYISIFSEGPEDSKTQYDKIVSDMLTGFRNTD